MGYDVILRQKSGRSGIPPATIYGVQYGGMLPTEPAQTGTSLIDNHNLLAPTRSAVTSDINSSSSGNGFGSDVIFGYVAS